jgi:hypothetical protein
LFDEITDGARAPRERDDYYLQVKAKMLALVDPNPVHQSKTRRHEPADRRGGSVQ